MGQIDLFKNVLYFIGILDTILAQSAGAAECTNCISAEG